MHAECRLNILSIILKLTMLTVLFIAITLNHVHSYNNGMGKTPIMGFSSWYPVESNVTEAYMKQQCNALISTGLFKKGYISCNVDEGWLKNRSANGTIIYDESKFPSGMKSLGDWAHSNGFMYGLYSSRGTQQCGSLGYNAPGSYGYYQQDANYVAAQGADYFKLDSCGSVGNMTDAFNQYQQFGQYLNKTGRPIYYDLCGWKLS